MRKSMVKIVDNSLCVASTTILLSPPGLSYWVGYTKSTRLYIQATNEKHNTFLS